MVTRALTWLGLALCVGCGAPSAAPASGFAWLEGVWTDGETTEAWARRGAVLYGAGVHGEHVELMRFDGRSFVAAPREPVVFALRRAGRRDFEVALADHDPEWVRYAREGEALVATIGDEVELARWRYRLTSTEPRMVDLDVRVERRDGVVTLTLAPCFCDAYVRCAGLVEDGALQLFAAVADGECDACVEASTGCDVTGGEVPRTSLGGRPLRAEGGAFVGSAPVLRLPVRPAADPRAGRGPG